MLLGNFDKHTDEENWYRLEYTIDPTEGATAAQPLPGKQAADLLVRVYGLTVSGEAVIEGDLVAEAKRCHAPPTATIDVAVEGYQGPSEYEVLLARLGPAIGAADPEDTLDELSEIELDDDDAIAHLACSSRLDVEEVTRMVAVAHASGGGSGTYALFRALGSNDMQDLLRLRPSTIIRILEDAARDNIIPPLGSIEDLRTGLHTLIGDAALAENLGPDAAWTLAQLLTIPLSSSGDRNTFIRKYVAHEGPIEDFLDCARFGGAVQ